LTSLGVQDGDTFSAQIIGNDITVTMTRAGVSTVIASATDNSGDPFVAGNPGMGFFIQTNGGPPDPQSFSFTSFTAEGL
jgi:hypothetical protein